MEFNDLQTRAVEIRNLYSNLEQKKYGKEWTREHIAAGLVGDVGDLSKAILAKAGVREMEDVDQKLAHELSDCLWAIIVLAHKYDIDLEKVFLENMDKLGKKITRELHQH